MALYEFQKDDGEVIELSFKMGECPKEVICDDGQKAVRIYSCPNIGLFSPNGQCNNSSALNADMKRRQEKADKSMRERWPSVKSK